ncbi:MAG: CDP-alcohol phosphatidyltransferase family protein [Chloroflexi bacterium]|nr:CDP-alcohol phosphatidyltransferase family protein [Chloroflexota bacterium]
MGNSRYRYLIPNTITFASLACGIIAILSSATGGLRLAGFLILASYILDLFDGELARRLNAGSTFGLQLDSLVDMVSLGTAPAVLAFFHLQAEEVSPFWLWLAAVLIPLAGAFRLARFNLLPVKKGQVDSMGLTISTAGATLTLAVLSDLAYKAEVLPDFTFIPFMLLLAALMVSKISFPSLAWVFSRRWVSYVLLLLFGTSAILLPSFANAWFIFNSGYLSVSLVRAGYRAVGH